MFINPLTSPGEGVSVFTYLYLSAGAPAQGEAKGLIIDKDKNNKIEYYKKMRKYIVEFTKKGMNGIIEFFYPQFLLRSA